MQKKHARKPSKHTQLAELEPRGPVNEIRGGKLSLASSKLVVNPTRPQTAQHFTKFCVEY